MTDNASKPVTVESALRSILKVSQDKSLTEKSLTEKRLRIQVWGYAKAAIELIEADQAVRARGVSSPLGGSGTTDKVVTVEVPVVAWLHEWSGGSKEVRSKLADDKYGLSEAIPLCFDEWGEILAWRWADGGGYNSRHRYSFVDPLEYPEEVEAQGAESVIGCRPLYEHPLAKRYKTVAYVDNQTEEKL